MCGWVDVIRERECVCVCVIREYVVRDRLSVRVGVLIGCVDKMCYWGRGVVDPPASVGHVGCVDRVCYCWRGGEWLTHLPEWVM